MQLNKAEKMGWKITSKEGFMHGQEYYPSIDIYTVHTTNNVDLTVHPWTILTN